MADNVTKRRLSWYGHIWRRDRECTTVTDDHKNDAMYQERKSMAGPQHMEGQIILIRNNNNGFDDQMTEDRKEW